MVIKYAAVTATSPFNGDQQVPAPKATSSSTTQQEHSQQKPSQQEHSSPHSPQSQSESQSRNQPRPATAWHGIKTASRAPPLSCAPWFDVQLEPYTTPSGEQAYRQIGPFPPPGPIPGPRIHLDPGFRAAAKNDEDMWGFVQIMDRRAAWAERVNRGEIGARDEEVARDK